MPVSDEAIADAGLHRPDIMDRQLGVDLPNNSLQRQPKRFRWEAGADDHEKVAVGTHA
jgi:hypothetical protein